METRQNIGYTITDSIHIGNTEFVIGENQTKYGTVVVEAASPKEALEKADAAYSMGRTVWDSGEYEFSDAKRLPDRSRGAR